MIRILATNITSPLGLTTEQNYQAVKSGCSALQRYEGKWKLQEPFCASLFSEEQMSSLMVDGFTRFESIILRSVREALSHAEIDISSNKVVFILSTTKGNVEMLGELQTEDEGLQTEDERLKTKDKGIKTADAVYPGIAAKRIATELGIKTEPIVVCNACISGVAAQVLAQRLLDAGLYDYAIVAGGEVQSKFIVSGFQSFKAVTDEACRPFDIERLGLNLGEGAGSIILSSNTKNDGEECSWQIVNGCISNDAYHLSSPHPQGEGYLLALQGVLGEEELATLSVHGTATMYNDQMESKAIQRAGLSDVPLTSLKGYYGHTMGAAGVIESIITMCATEEGIVLGARGFEEIGVSGKVSLSNQSQPTEKKAFVKMLSGFGGCNGAVKYLKDTTPNAPSILPCELKTTHKVSINTENVYVDGVLQETASQGKALLKELYKAHIDDYPKFYKMDLLTKLTFVASELLLKAEGYEAKECKDRAVVIFNRSSSIISDKQYFETIKDDDNCFPSPAVFLYTLPNLTTGEIAIRNHFYGETSFYILPEKNEKLMNDIIHVSFADKKTTSIIAGWIDCPDEEHFEAELSIYNKQ